MFRQGENRTDLNTNSRASIAFFELQPYETAARIAWVRVMPLAQRRPENETAEDIYLADEGVRAEVTFKYYLWADGQNAANSGRPVTGDFQAEINTRQALLRGFVRTLLLPPWANGFLAGLALLFASLLNALPKPIVQHLDERRRVHQMQGLPNRSTTHARRHPVRRYILGTHLTVLGLQVIFWLLTIITIVSLAIWLAERFIICPLIVTSIDSCVRYTWPIPLAIATAALAALFFIPAYVAGDDTPGSVSDNVRSLIQPYRERVKHSRPVAWWRWRRTRRERATRDALSLAAAAAARTARQEEQRRQQEAGEQAQRDAERLADRIRDLRHDLKKAPSDAALRRFQERHDAYAASLAGLPAALQKPKTKEALHQSADLLAQRQRYAALSARLADVSGPAQEGDEAAGRALGELRTELTGGAFAHEPIKGAAEALLGQVKSALAGYEDAFVKPLQLAQDDGLPAASRYLAALDPRRPVRFYDLVDLKSESRAILSADAAAELARGRSRQHGQTARAAIDKARNKLTSLLKAHADRTDPEFLTQIARLRGQVEGWPPQLPAWTHLEEDDRETLSTAVTQLREDLRAY